MVRLWHSYSVTSPKELSPISTSLIRLGALLDPASGCPAGGTIKT
jgi:hypothetical protein